MHLIKHVLYTCFLLFIFGQHTFGQDTTRYVKPSTKFFTERSIDRGLDYQQIDTSINRVEIFHPCYKNYVVFQDLGNMGTPARPLVFDITRQTGFSYAQNPFDAYFANKAEIATYYNTKTPYTDLFYSQGSKEMLFIKALHSQNILPRWNAGVDFTHLSSQGFQLRQQTSTYSLRFFTALHSKNKRYALLANILWNKGVVEESGGIQSDSSYESLTGRSRQVYTNLAASQTRYKNRTAYLKQYFRFGKPSTIVSGEDTIYDFRNRLQVSHTLQAEEISYIFENNGDTNSVLLPHQYYDVGTSTFDSAYYGKLSNRVQMQYFNPRTLLFSNDSVMDVFSASLKYDMINVSQKPFVRQFNNTILEGSYENARVSDHSTRFLAKADFVLSGYNQGDYSATANLNYRFSIFSFDALADVRSYRPDFAMMLFKSNQFIWENNFKQTHTQHLALEISTRTFRHNLHLNYHIYQLENWVYAGLNQTPEQSGTPATVQRIGLNKTIQLWKFYLEHELFYQTSSSSIIRLPEFSGMIRYYYQARLFKVMRFQFGFNAYYNTAYYGNAYNPATRLFYLQDDTRIGNYPYIDPFFIGEVKRAALFAKYEHANQGWIKSGFYYTPHYPVSQSSFRFGIRWRFYD